LIKSSLLDQEFSPNNTTVNKSSDKYFFFLFCLFVVVNLRVDIYFVVALIVLVWKLAKTSVVYLYVFVTGLSSYPVYAQVEVSCCDAGAVCVHAQVVRQGRPQGEPVAAEVDGQNCQWANDHVPADVCYCGLCGLGYAGKFFVCFFSFKS